MAHENKVTTLLAHGKIKSVKLPTRRESCGADLSPGETSSLHIFCHIRLAIKAVVTEIKSTGQCNEEWIRSRDRYFGKEARRSRRARAASYVRAGSSRGRHGRRRLCGNDRRARRSGEHRRAPTLRPARRSSPRQARGLPPCLGGPFPVLPLRSLPRLGTKTKHFHVEVTGQDPDSIQKNLTAAVNAVRAAAMTAAQGTLITQHDFYHFTVSPSSGVPFGETREQRRSKHVHVSATAAPNRPAIEHDGSEARRSPGSV